MRLMANRIPSFTISISKNKIKDPYSVNKTENSHLSNYFSKRPLETQHNKYQETSIKD